METPRELVRRSLEFRSPGRVPRQMWLLPWATQNFPEKVREIQGRYPDDIVSSPEFLKQRPEVAGDAYTPGTFVDEWGCTFENVQYGIIGIVKEPLVKAWEDVDKIRPPSALLSVDKARVNLFCRKSDKFVLAGCSPRPFERLQFIRGTENLLVDLVDRPRELLDLIDTIHQFYLDELLLWAGTEIDGLVMSDDWGSQGSLLISPRMWRTVFKPLYKDYVDIAHSHGKYIFMHSDGYILDIIPDLIELGLDGLNCQVFSMGVEELGKRFTGQITFWGEVDRQHILPYGSRQDVIRAVVKMKESLYSHGGVIAQCEFGPGVNPDNVQLVFETWEKMSTELEPRDRRDDRDSG